MTDFSNTSTNLWWNAIFSDEEIGVDIVEALKREEPNMVSITFERTCNLQCRHCIYQKEHSSKKISESNQLSEIILGLVSQLQKQEENPYNDSPKLLHEGRVIQPWHIETLAKAKSIRPDLQIGLIDNGSYVKHLEHFKRNDLRLSWIDISVDGLEETHNHQRDPIRKKAFQNAMDGLRHAREVVTSSEDGGRVASLFTLTSINYHDIAATAETLFSQDLVDTFGVTTLSPAREPNKLIETTVEQFAVAWKQLQQVGMQFNDEHQARFFFAVYRVEDLVKIANIIGPRTFLKVLREETLINKDELTLNFDGVEVRYAPLSTWPKETVLVDADGVNRLAYSMQHTLAELRSGNGEGGVSTENYSVAQLVSTSGLTETYQRSVEQWWKFFGRDHLHREREILRALGG